MKCLLFALVVTDLVYSLSAKEHERMGRVFRGTEAVSGQFKYAAVVVARSIGNPPNICGGSLIAANWVLTAAHCIHEKVKAKIYLGATSRDEAEVKYKVQDTDFIPHPEFRLSGARNDIALIRIPKTRDCGKIGYAKLPQPSANDFADRVAITMGWGVISNNGDHASILLWTRLKTISNAECSKTYRSIVDTEICAYTKLPYGSPCAGDSGGPLVLMDSDELIGVISNIPSKVGCESGQHAVSMRVLSYMPWISAETGIAF